MARTFDLWGALDPYNWSPNGDVADSIAMHLDWATVGQDIANAMDSYISQVKEEESRQLQLVFPLTD
jgi:hypothetical protein